MSAIEMHKHLSNKVIFNITNLIKFDVSWQFAFFLELKTNLLKHAI